MIVNNKEYLWVEKYRPQRIADIIITEDMRSKLLKWKKDGEIPNIGLFSNTPGLGKSATSKAIINDLEADSMFMNSSKDNGIDLVRNKIHSFASAVSFEGTTKIVVLDEVDGTSPQFQEAFRGSIEEFSKNCRFILTGNYKDKIIEPVLNRLVIFDLDNVFHKNKGELAKQIYDRLCFILENEQVEYESQDVKTLISQYYPSMREMINTLQSNIGDDNKLKIDFSQSDLNKLYTQLVSAIQSKSYEKCRLLASDINIPNGFYKYIYKNLDKLFVIDSIPQVVAITHHFMSTNTNSRDPEITIAAYCARLIMAVDVKFL